ncbi:MAG: hypothetical protein AAFQ09_05530 [Pseudomonadota bacterium]
MNLRRIGSLAACLVSTSLPALADWDIQAGPTDLIPSTFAFGVSETGQTLSVFCNDGVPNIMAWGYPAQAGASRQEALDIIVSGERFTVTTTHVPPDGYWVGPAQDSLIEALQNGRVVTMIPVSATDTEISLRGSSRTISSALSGCGNVVQTTADTAPTPPPDRTQINAEIAAACGGEFVLDDAALLTGLIDGDDIPDFVLDWAGVTCQASDLGRGAGNCGINMCQISVVLSERDNEVVLGLAPELVPDAFGRARLKTVALRPSCSDGALDCVFLWNLTDEGLEAMPAPQ